jgi:hypothetical protein
MWEDPIVAEVRAARAAHAAQFDNDLLAIYRDLKAQEQQSGQEFVSYPARRVRPQAKSPGRAVSQPQPAA